MKTASTVSRYLLGLIFTIFGLNGFLQFIHQPPPTGLALQFLTALVASHEIAVIMFLQLVCGVLLLVNRYVPLALIILGPIIINIFLFHAFMAPAGLPLAIIVAILWIFCAWNFRRIFAAILRARPTSLDLAA